MVNALEPDGSPFDIIERTAHCMFDLGDLRIFSCINPRVLSFRGVESQFLRGIFFPKRVIMPLKFTSDRRGFGEYCRNPWENFKFSVSMAWISKLTMVYFHNLLDFLGRWHCPLDNHLDVLHGRCFLC